MTYRDPFIELLLKADKKVFAGINFPLGLLKSVFSHKARVSFFGEIWPFFSSYTSYDRIKSLFTKKDHKQDQEESPDAAPETFFISFL